MTSRCSDITYHHKIKSPIYIFFTGRRPLGGTVHLALLPAVVLDARRFFWQPLGEVFLRRPKVCLIFFFVSIFESFSNLRSSEPGSALRMTPSSCIIFCFRHVVPNSLLTVYRN